MSSLQTLHQTENSAPYVFISYSHDSEQHRLRVLSLARELRGKGVDVHLDREIIAPGQGWIRWMHEQMERADFVLVVCTEIYVRRAEGREAPGTGLGANFEGVIISNDLYEKGLVTDKYVPVVFDSNDRPFIPYFLRGRTWFDVSNQSHFDRLYSLLTGQPEVDLGPLGPRVSRAPVEIPPLHRVVGKPDAIVPATELGTVRALVGLAVDVSGSMAESMPRRLGPSSSRLEAARESLERIAQEAKQTAQRIQQRDRSTVALFAYAFGLRIGSVCDLLSLMKVAKGVITQEEIEEVKREVEAEARQKYGAYRDLGGLLGSFLGDSALKMAEDFAKNVGESTVRSRLLARIRPRIEDRLAHAGDTTISIGDLSELWTESSETFENASDLIFGDTPMCQAFELIVHRFERERRNLAAEVPSVLFILSDGEPTDGDPIPLAMDLRRSGVTIVSCFVTDRDIVLPRALFKDPEPYWGNAARLMFDIASPSEPDNPFVTLLVRQGWEVPDRARLFVQVNHSEVLEEFLRGLLGYVDDAGQVLPRGR